jgi:hypothetical protein
MEDQLQHQRFERKYFVTEAQALRIRKFLQCYLVPDQFSLGRPEYSYPVHSIYLDSADLITYWATVHCEKKRFKLRVRFYDDNPDSPVFFEIKRRENECVLKQRGGVRRDVAPVLLAGHAPALEDMTSKKPDYLVALQRFCYFMLRLGARPMMHIAYEREAWVSEHNNSVRVTVDREVRGESRRQALFQTRMANPVYPFGQQRVLELKFTDRFPDWFNVMVRHFDLLQTGAPKYCGSIALSGEDYDGEIRQVADYC